MDYGSVSFAAAMENRSPYPVEEVWEPNLGGVWEPEGETLLLTRFLYYNFKGQVTDISMTVAYGRKVLKLWKTLQVYLRKGKFLHMDGAEVLVLAGEVELLYSVFEAKSGKQAVAAANQEAEKPMTVRVSTDTGCTSFLFIPRRSRIPAGSLSGLNRAVRASWPKRNSRQRKNWHFRTDGGPILLLAVPGKSSRRHIYFKGVFIMRKNFGKKPWLYPLPVLIIGTYNEDGTADAMNAAWGGLYDADKVVICLSAGHRTTANIRNRRAFTVSFADAAHVAEADYVGIVSANDVPDKLQRAGIHTVRSDNVDAPLLDIFPMTLECRLLKINEDGNVIGEIVNVSADGSILDAQGNIDLSRFEPITFDPVHNTYRKLGEKAGDAFRDGAAFK